MFSGPPTFAPKLVLHPGRPWPVNRIQKEIIRVENFVAEILVRLAVDGACTSFSAEIVTPPENLPHSGPKLLVCTRNFLDGVLRRNQDGQVDIADVSAADVQKLRALVPKRPLTW